MPDTPANNLAAELNSLRIDRSARQRGLPSWLKWLLAALAVAAGGWFVYQQVSDRLLIPTVETTTVALVTPTQAQQLLVATGYVVPQRKANVAPRTGGRLAKILVEDGTEVKAGQLIAVLEDQDYKAQLLQAQANYKSAEAKLLRAEVDARDAQRAYDREQVVQRKGVSSPAAQDAVVARLDSAKAQSVASKADMAAAAALVEVARVNLDNCYVRAPFAGRITQKLADIGEIVFGAVGAGAGGNGGVASLADFSSLMVEADVSESQVIKVQPGTPAEITLDAFPGRSWRAKVHEVRPKVDRAKATVTVKVAFIDPMDGVLPDMGAKVTFLAKELSASATQAAPTPAVQPGAVAGLGDNKVLWVIQPDGTLASQPVVLGPALGNLISIKSGPAPGTKVVDKPAADFHAGMHVKEKSP